MLRVVRRRQPFANAVTLQLLNTEGACWSAQFSTPATSNTIALFADKSD